MLLKRHRPQDFMSMAVIKHLLYVPAIFFKIKNWYQFLLNYTGFRNKAHIYEFRNDIKIKTNEGVDSATIAVIFIKKDYGDIADNSTIIDIGANIGVFSIYAASTSKNTKVYAYEPMPSSFDLLVQNIKINNLEKDIVPFQLGVADVKKTKKLFVSTRGSPFHSIYNSAGCDKYIEMECVSLENIFDQNKIQQCDLLKLDCEGAEFLILYNTPQKIFETVKEIRLEYHGQSREGYNRNRLLSYLDKVGFELTQEKQDSRDAGSAWLQRKQ